MGRIKKLLVTATAAAASIAILRKLRTHIDTAVNPYDVTVDPRDEDDRETEESDDINVDSEVLEEGDQRVELDHLAYETVVDEYGIDASIKSNTLDEEGVDPFDDDEDGYQPTMQVTADSRFILQTGTAGTITEDTIETFVKFRESGYRRLLLVPEADVNEVEDLVADTEASITVCSPNTLENEL